MTHEATPAIPDSLVEKIAKDAGADERSVWKRLAGGRLRRLTERRVDESIAKFLPSEPVA